MGEGVMGKMNSGEVLDSQARLMSSLRDTISEYGWTVVSIPTKWWQLWNPPWAYSIGLYETYKLPDVVLMGRMPELTSAMMTNIHELIKMGERIGDGTELEGVLMGQTCIFRLIEKKNYKTYLPWAIDYYGSTDFPVLQCVWPDTQGKYPWQEGHERRVRRFQKLLFP
jgi:hypothetical protein